MLTLGWLQVRLAYAGVELDPVKDASPFRLNHHVVHGSKITNWQPAGNVAFLHAGAAGVCWC
jgi:hypothetical protein